MAKLVGDCGCVREGKDSARLGASWRRQCDLCGEFAVTTALVTVISEDQKLNILAYHEITYRRFMSANMHNKICAGTILFGDSFEIYLIRSLHNTAESVSIPFHRRTMLSLYLPT